jgi:hypothetical protein
MVTEINRKIAYKRIRPGSQVNDQDKGQGIKIPVITEITVKDPTDRGQESTYTLDNTYTGWRDVHYSWVGPKGSTDAKEGVDITDPIPGDCVLVERVDELRVKDPVDRGQETFPILDNYIYDPHGPPFFKTHLKTHIVNFWNDPSDPNSGTAAVVELIDELIVKDPVDRGQETHYFLQNPQDDAAANAQLLNPDLVDITRTDNIGNVAVDPPYRFDPFQNLIYINGYYVLFYWIWQDWGYGGYTEMLLLTGRQLIGDPPLNPPLGFTYAVIPGADGWGIPNNTKADMSGDPSDPLSDANPINTKDNGTDAQPILNAPATQPAIPPPDDQSVTLQYGMDISHVIKGCDFTYPSDINAWAATNGYIQVPECPRPTYPSGPFPDQQAFATSETSYPSKTYYNPWLFMAAPTKPPGSDATDDQVAAYKPFTFRVKFSNYPQSFVTPGGYGPDLDGDQNFAPTIRYNALVSGITPFPAGAGSGNVACLVLKSEDVELKLDDKVRPIRPKGESPPAVYNATPGTRDWFFEQQKWWQSIMNIAQTVTYLQSNVYTNDLPGSPDTLPINHGVTTYFSEFIVDTAYEWHFEMRELKNIPPGSSPPTKTMPICWPVTPAAKTNPNPPDVAPFGLDSTHYPKINQYYYTTIYKDRFPPQNPSLPLDQQFLTIFNQTDSSDLIDNGTPPT